jgi:hypothetical protein
MHKNFNHLLNKSKMLYVVSAMKDWKRTVRFKVRTALWWRTLRQEMNASCGNILILRQRLQTVASRPFMKPTNISVTSFKSKAKVRNGRMNRILLKCGIRLVTCVVYVYCISSLCFHILSGQQKCKKKGDERKEEINRWHSLVLDLLPNCPFKSSSVIFWTFLLW